MVYNNGTNIVHVVVALTLLGIAALDHVATCSAFHMPTGKEMVNQLTRRNKTLETTLLSQRQRQNSDSSSGHIGGKVPFGIDTENYDPILSVSLPRRNMIVSCAAFLTVTTRTAINDANADVSDGNSLPQGAQQFARTIKLKTDLKDVGKRLLTASDDNPIDKKEWENISKFLRTVYSTADNDMKSIAKGLSYNPPNQKQANTDVDEIKKYSQAGDVSASKQDATRLASILAKISELLDDFLSSLSDIPDEI